jgi:hypothetical protein
MTQGAVVHLGELAMSRGVQPRVRCKSAKDRTLILVASFAARFVNMERKKRNEDPIDEKVATSRVIYDGQGIGVIGRANVGGPGSKVNKEAVWAGIVAGRAFKAIRAAWIGQSQST